MTSDGPLVMVDFGGTVTKVGFQRPDGALLTARVPSDGRLASLLPLSDVVRRLAGTHRAVMGGAALPGIVDPDAGVLTASNGKYDEFRGVDVRRWLADVAGVPRGRIVLENDARAALVGEVSGDGCAPGARNAVLVIIGTGIGTAVVADGALLRGSHAHAGVLGGHFTIEVDGPPCTCGNRGCVEAVAGSWALGRTWADTTKTPAPAGTDYRSLLDGVASGDAESLRVWGRVVPVLEALVVTLCHAYDPDLVIMAGGPLAHPAFRPDELMRGVHGRLFPSSHRPLLRVSRTPELSVLRGLAALARQNAEGTA